MSFPLSISLFVIAGLCEIGGGYFVWLWIREGKPFGYAAAGAILLILYGIIPTFQPAHFGRVYAAYGGMFIVLSLLSGCGGRAYGMYLVNMKEISDHETKQEPDEERNQ